MPGCVFCDIVRRERPASYVYEDDATLAFMDHQPANDGHVLVIPKIHAATIYDLNPETAARVVQAVVAVARAIRASLQPDGLSIWQSNGEAAGQEVPHVHFHLLPRYVGDGALRLAPKRSPIREHTELDLLAARIRLELES